jgi:hypothetical protein
MGTGFRQKIMLKQKARSAVAILFHAMALPALYPDSWHA